jgi:phosphosulfolactate synthase
MTKQTQMLSLSLPERTAKPRTSGLSNLVDNGYGLAELQDKLSWCHDYVDIIKFGWASGYISANLVEKVALSKRYDVRPCPGGMMFELCYHQNKIEDYAAWLDDKGFDLVEVSNGSLAIPETEKRKMIEYFASRGFTVLSEVGSKDITVVTPPEDWVEYVRADMQAGAWKVILEGRADASAGIYHADGSLHEDIIEHVLNNVASEDLIFEAPHKRQMAWFITRIGSNVNIGNVPLGEVLNLETLRLGLRGDTVAHLHAN